MNEELKQLLVEALRKTGGAIEQSIDFAAAQAPDLIHQALLWHGVKSGLLFAIFLATVAFAVWVNIGVTKLFREDNNYFLGYFLNVIFVQLCLLTFSLDWLKILIAPKLWLLEYIASLAK